MRRSAGPGRGGDSSSSVKGKGWIVWLYLVPGFVRKGGRGGSEDKGRRAGKVAAGAKRHFGKCTPGTGESSKRLFCLWKKGAIDSTRCGPVLASKKAVDVQPSPLAKGKSGTQRGKVAWILQSVQVYHLLALEECDRLAVGITVRLSVSGTNGNVDRDREDWRRAPRRVRRSGRGSWRSGRGRRSERASRSVLGANFGMEGRRTLSKQE